MSELKHSPTPWRMEGIDLVAADGFSICEMGFAEEPTKPEDRTNVRVVNCHDELVAMLEAAYRELNEIRARDGVPYTHQGIKSSVDEDYFGSVVDKAREAIVKAKGEL